MHKKVHTEHYIKLYSLHLMPITTNGPDINQFNEEKKKECTISAYELPATSICGTCFMP